MGDGEFDPATAHPDRVQDLAPLVARRWLTPRSLPDCQRAFDWLRAQNALTPELIEQRGRMALKEGNSGFAREMAAFLPPERAEPVLEVLGTLGVA